jgi:hypothetical protein
LCDRTCLREQRDDFGARTAVDRRMVLFHYKSQVQLVL